MEKRYDFRLLWSSNAIWANTGYGVQAKYVLPRLMKMGIQCAQHAWWGLQGSSITVQLDEGPLRIYPVAYDPWGSDIIGEYVKDFKADLVVSLLDIWVLPIDYRKRVGVPWLPWFPIDQAPCPPSIVERVKTAEFPTTYSLFGTEEARKAGVAADYVPHGVDCNVFKPLDRAKCRQAAQLPEDAFVIAMVGANKGLPSRKGFPEAALMFKAFHDRHPEAILYLHTCESEALGGVNFARLFGGIPGFPVDAVRFVDQVAYKIGLDERYMAAVYNAADVLLQPSYNEGFGLPILEAEACGCPVIVNDCTSMSELCWAGVAVPPASPLWTPLGGWAYAPDVDGFVEALESIWRMVPCQRQALSDQARAGALAYDWDRVVEQYWVPLLDRVERERGHVHRWAATGIHNYPGAPLSVPCLDPQCAGELMIHRNGDREIAPRGFSPLINGIALDIEDDPESGVYKTVAREIALSYDLDSIPFEPGDVVLDLGAHVGMVSIYLAKKYPQLEIYAVEPDPDNFKRLVRNMAVNEVDGVVQAWAFAVTGDGRDVIIHKAPGNSGGGGVYASGEGCVVASVTLDELCRDAGQRVKLLKIDIEGAEWEVLKAATCLDQIDYVRGELHLDVPGADAEGLTKLLTQHIPAEHIRLQMQGEGK